MNNHGLDIFLWVLFGCILGINTAMIIENKKLDSTRDKIVERMLNNQEKIIDILTRLHDPQGN